MSKPRRQSEVTRDLEDLADRLTEIAIDECDPTRWPGHGKRVGEMDKAERGDRYWSKQNAQATIMLVKQLHNLVQQRKNGQKARIGLNPTMPTDDEVLAAQTAQAERDAAEAVKRALMKARKH